MPVSDIEPPTFPYGCTPNIMTSASALGTNTLVNYSLPYVLDNSGENLVLVGDPASGSAFGIGVTMVTITASDSQNNTASCRFNVTLKGKFTPLFVTLCFNPNEAMSVCLNTTAEFKILMQSSQRCKLYFSRNQLTSGFFLNPKLPYNWTM